MRKKTIKIKDIKKDAKKKDHYFVFFNTIKDEIKIQVYSRWIFIHFFKAII